MKPLYLVVEGLKSIKEEQKVDFLKLAQNGIFGIFGKTGSGKSTVLDAIVLALYGEVVENLKNGEFINVESARARVELTFCTYVDGVEKNYKVERIYKYNKNRTLVTSSASLWEMRDGEYYSVAENALSVTKKLREEIIGLEKKDFLKCIALPQGEFSAFVKMTKGERLDVIGKLFDVTKYGDELAAKVKRKDGELLLEYERLAGRSEALGGISEEEMENQTLTLKTFEGELDIVKKEKEEFAQKAEKAKETKNLISELNLKNEELKQKFAYKPVIEQKRKDLLELDELKPLARVIDLFEKATSEKLDCEQRLALSERKKIELDELMKSLATKKSKCEEYSQKIIELNVKKAQIQSLEALEVEVKEKKDKLAALRNEYSKKKLEKSAAEKVKNENEKLFIDYKKQAEELNSEKILSDIKALSAAMAVGEIVDEESEFLSGLLDELKSELNSESPVYGLIASRIKYLAAKKIHVDGDLTERIKEAADLLSKQAELALKAAKCEGERDKAEQKSLALDEKTNELLLEGQNLKKECDEKSARVQAALSGQTIKEALAAIDSEVKEKTQFISDTNESLEKATAASAECGSKISALKAELNGLEKTRIAAFDELNEKLGGESGIEEAKKKLARANEEKDRALVCAFDDGVKILEGRIGELNANLALVPPEYLNFEEIFEKNRKKCEFFDELKKKYDELSVKHKNDLKNLRERCIINERMRDVSRERDLLGRLLELVRAGRFMEFIAEEYLKEIADEAENRVLELTNGRYGLVYEGNFFVTDNFHGGVRRPVAGLSGGETFVVSLSLALALSKQISAKALKPIDFFFLDEGFGTLDEDLVDSVASCLEKLQRANFTVGLITHVSELKTRIGSKLLVSGATAAHGTVIEEAY